MSENRARRPVEVVVVRPRELTVNQLKAGYESLFKILVVGPFALQRLALRAGYELSFGEAFALVWWARWVSNAVTAGSIPARFPAAEGETIKERQRRRKDES